MTEQNPVSSSENSASVLASNNLIERIKAAIDKDERIANEASGTSPIWSPGGGDSSPYLYTVDTDMDYCLAEVGLNGVPNGSTPGAVVRHAARHDPDAIGRKVKGARKILDWHVDCRKTGETEEWTCDCNFSGDDEEWTWTTADNLECELLPMIALMFGIEETA